MKVKRIPKVKEISELNSDLRLNIRHPWNENTNPDPNSKQNYVLPQLDLKVSTIASQPIKPFFSPIFQYFQYFQNYFGFSSSGSQQSSSEKLLKEALGPGTDTCSPRFGNNINRNISSIKKIVIIGVHGWYPNKFIQKVVGEPIGTSNYFATKMNAALKAFFMSRDIDVELESSDVSIKVIPLEGQGKIFQRVENLFNMLIETASNDLKHADIIIFSAHSQGCPVSALILQKLIRERMVSPFEQKFGILAMAGISHGPFPHLKSSVIVQYVETEQAKELFDFNDPTSNVSVAYMDAMKDILDAGTRYVALASWYDQVVPVYSACIHGISHQNIYRALYIDSKDYQPDFLSHLLVFALKLRNKGMDDYGLIVSLSELVAGSIYGFGTQGHSAVYEETQSYTLGIAWLLSQSPLETTPPTTSSFKLEEERNGLFKAPSKVNPFQLPWSMALLLTDASIQKDKELSMELEMIKMLYLRWVPTSAALKEIKYRLEPMRSKL